MSESLRRSTRRVKKRASYAVGDIVEISRGNATLNGRLVIKLSEGEPSRWLVTFDQGSWKDEELSEDLFGSIVGKQDESESSKAADNPSNLQRKAKKKSGNKHSLARTGDGKNSVGTSAGSSAEEQSGNPDMRKKKNKSVSFSPEGRPTESDASSPKDPVRKRSQRSKVSDREQRSRRRQAMIEEEAQTTTVKRPRTHASVPHTPKKVRAGTDEEVIKVPMLTGTLYLYRGLRRRAEFIRKY